MKRTATTIVDQVLRDIRGRKGIGDELEAIEPAIYRELRAGLIKIVEEELAKQEGI